MSDQVADVLDNAADLLEREGWIQGSLDNGHGYCAIGAIWMVETDSDWSRALSSRALSQQISCDPEKNGWWLAKWNDDPSRTKQQVLDAFRLAAKAERMADL